jgi:hypothetical protein
VRFHRFLEAFDGRQQVREIIGALGSGHCNAPLPQPVRDFGSDTILV